jgi:hypothetical protein
MKNLKPIALYLFLCTSSAALSANEPAQNQGYLSGLYSSLKQWLEHTPLVPGWQATPEQRRDAHQELEKLTILKDELTKKLAENPKLPPEKIKDILNQITTIEKEINNKKIILGDTWSNRRTLLTTTVALGLSALGLTAMVKYQNNTIPATQQTPKRFKLPDFLPAYKKNDHQAYAWKIRNRNTGNETIEKDIDPTYLPGDPENNPNLQYSLLINNENIHSNLTHFPLFVRSSSGNPINVLTTQYADESIDGTGYYVLTNRANNTWEQADRRIFGTGGKATIYNPEREIDLETDINYQ